VNSSRISSLAPGLLVTGTDTGVGKTALGQALLRLAARRGLAVAPFKPAETGCEGGQPQDALRLRAAARRDDLPLERVCPFRFGPPVAPAAAAAAAGVRITGQAVVEAAAALAPPGAPLLVETAGGLLSPYAPDLTAADLAPLLRLPVLLVARNGLGTINHTALAIAELRRRALPLLGLVLVTTSPTPTPDQPSNPGLIAALTGVTPLGTLPFVVDPTADALADALARSLDVTPLLAALAPA
jgi:dethiobiotin synthetase